MRVEKKVSSEKIFDGKIIRVTRDVVEIEGSGESIREVVWHGGAVCVSAVIDDKLILVEQYRYALGQSTWEIPAGKLEASENPYDAAIRELAEETGYLAQTLEKKYSFYSAPGFTNELVTLYKAHDLSKTNDFSLDADEFVNVAMFSRDQLKELLNNGEIIDGKTIIAIQDWINE